MNVEKMVKRSSLGTIRKRLSDITNLKSQHNSPLKHKEISPILDESSTNDYIQQLLKENAAMMKLIQDKDKIIEITEVEIQKLKTTLQKCQLQNCHLAKSNSHMLADLNLSKDRLKALQHELACKDTLFKAKIRELEDKRGAKNECEANVVPQVVKQSADHPLPPENKAQTAKTKRPARSRSMGPTTSEQANEKKMDENKRRCLRRQSMRVNPKESELFEIEIDVAKFPPSEDKPSSSTEKEDKHGSQQQSSSLGRPIRRVAEKVHSYKEPSRLVKLRRSA